MKSVPIQHFFNMKNNLKNLAEDIIASYDARVRVVGEIVEDTHQILDGFKEKRQEMSNNLQGVLAKSESLRKKDFNAMMQDILLTQHKREENVKKMLADFREEEARVAEQLKELLKRGEKIRLADFKKTLGRIRKDQVAREANTGEQVRVELATMQSEVYKMLEVFKKEREAATSEWKKVRELLSEKEKKTS
ncbi:MAG: hypothetical protein NTV77_03530 [Candidatus Azambacteria bacterium]|nr:hypothetical protein [Candidatus Azambacteria bacterium]